jgi:hypothetical protein
LIIASAGPLPGASLRVIGKDRGKLKALAAAGAMIVDADVMRPDSLNDATVQGQLAHARQALAAA